MTGEGGVGPHELSLVEVPSSSSSSRGKRPSSGSELASRSESEEQAEWSV